ncbi:MAG TPA: glycosyltransferase family 4 protein [Gemmatimonadaceae bacterium]|nr:glycosyltransferase family 4 protein [Gemmatimonadaceae bacterium]
MRVLLVNWQDRENPLGGGAEIHMHEIFGRLASWGHDVTLLCGGWKGAPQRAVLDGMNVHRVGTRYSFPFGVKRYWSRVLKREPFDILVEDINKVPLYTPRWGAGKVLALVPHLFGETALQELGAVFGTAVWFAERPLAAVYRRTPFEAISDSTADDLVGRGIPREHIRVIYPGVELNAYTPDPSMRAPVPTFAYLGRLKKYKGVEIVIRAFAKVPDPRAVLEIAGAGDHRPALEQLVSALGLTGRVRFLGFITESEKRALLRRVWALAFASPKEGWGLTNVEAAASGTPVVASNSPGLRESTREGDAGFLVPHGDVDAFADRLTRLAAAPALVASMGVTARKFSETFTWDRAARMTEAHLRTVTEGEGEGNA